MFFFYFGWTIFVQHSLVSKSCIVNIFFTCAFIGLNQIV